MNWDSFKLSTLFASVLLLSHTGLVQGAEGQTGAQTKQQGAPTQAGEESRATAETQVKQATRALGNMMKTPEERIPTSVLQRAEGLVIVPDIVKAALLVGGRYGTGVMLAKTGENEWSNPVFVSITGGSVGLQAGYETSTLFLIMKQKEEIDEILRGNFKLGVDASVAAGPAGAKAKTATGANILAYQQASGLFAGVEVTGSVLQIDEEAMQDYYGAKVSADQILSGKAKVEAPQSVEQLKKTLQQYISQFQTEGT